MELIISVVIKYFNFLFAFKKSVFTFAPRDRQREESEVEKRMLFDKRIGKKLVGRLVTEA